MRVARCGRLLRLLVVATIVVPTLMLLPSRGHACMCGDAPTLEEAFEHSDLVFRGTVTSITHGRFYDENSFHHDFEVEFNVVAAWKGSPDSVIVVLSDFTDACGYEFWEGEEFVVYARGNVVDGICGRTAPSRLASQALTFLGQGYRVRQDVGYPSGGSGGLAKTSASATGTVFDLQLSHLPALFARSSPDAACRAKTQQR